MGTNSAGTVSSGNEGQTDVGRGGSINFPYSKGQRETGKKGSGSSIPNSEKPDDLKRTVSDPRLS